MKITRVYANEAKGDKMLEVMVTASSILSPLRAQSWCGVLRKTGSLIRAEEIAMEDSNFTLVEMVRNPRMSLGEASELTRDGHYYVYRYHGMEGKFYRATVPSGAGDIHFRLLEPTEKIPLGGWTKVETSKLSASQIKLVTK